MGAEDKRLGLRTNLVWMVAGTAIYAGCLWAVVVLLAKLGTPEAVGYFTMGLAYTAPVFALTSLNTRIVQATDTQEEFSFSFSVYAGQRALGAFASLAIVGAFLALPIHDAQTRYVTMLIAVSKSVETASDVFYGLYQQAERMDGIGRSQILRGVGMVVAMATVYWISADLVLAVATQVAAWACVLVFHDVPFARKLRAQEGGLWPRFPLQKLRRLGWLAAPLGVSVFLTSIYMNIPRYFISEFSGIYEVGIFSALAYLTKIGMKITQAVGQTLIPRLAKHFAENEIWVFAKIAVGALSMASAFGAVATGVSFAAGDEILTRLYRPEYAEFGTAFVVIIAAGSMSAVNWLLVNILNATRSFRAQVPLAAVPITICLVGSVLMRSQGMIGVAWAWLAAEVVQVAFGLALVVWAVWQQLRAE